MAAAPVGAAGGAAGAPPAPLPWPRYSSFGGEQHWVDEGGFAVASDGSRLRVQPAKVFLAMPPGDILAERYQKAGIFQLLPCNLHLDEKPKAWCNMCGCDVALHTKKNTAGQLTVQYSGLAHHIISRHPAYLTAADVKDKNPWQLAALNAAVEKRPRTDDAAGRGAVSRDDDLSIVESKEIVTELTALMLVVDGQPANSIAHLGLRHLLTTLARQRCPEFSSGDLPSYYLVDKMMVELAEKHFKRVASEIKKHTAPVRWYPIGGTVIVDGWDNSYGKNLLGVVVQLITECVLYACSTRPVGVSHSPRNGASPCECSLTPTPLPLFPSPPLPPQGL